MSKAAAAIGTLLLFISAMEGQQPKSEGSAGKPKQSTEQALSTERADQSPAKPTDREGAKRPQGWLAFWSSPEGVSDTILLLTMGFIAWQAFETRKSADATARSVKLQETQFRQWIEYPETWEVGSTSVHLAVKQADLTLRFGLVNHTSWPLTVLSISTRIEKETPMTVSPACELRPNEAYPMHLEKVIVGDQLDRFRKNDLNFDVLLEIVFLDVLAERRSQLMDLTCTKCGQNNLKTWVTPRTVS